MMGWAMPLLQIDGEPIAIDDRTSKVLCASRSPEPKVGDEAASTMPQIAPWAFVLVVPDFNRTAEINTQVVGLTRASSVHP